MREMTILGAWPVEHTCSIWPEPRAAPAFDGAIPSLPRWIGVLPYEAFRWLERGHEASDRRAQTAFSKCEWWRYGAVAVVRDSVEVWGDDQLAVDRLAAALTVNRLVEPVHLHYRGVSESDQVHARRVERVLQAISRGELYQVNLARTFQFDARGSPIGLFERFFSHSQVPFGFAIDAGNGRAAVGASPELCLEIRSDGRLLTRPIKGTRPRGGNAVQDAHQLESLCSDPKELAELNMVIDLERNDLARVAETGTVAVLSSGEVESFEAVHHRVATVCAQLRCTVPPYEVLRAFLPSGSVTGAPKVSAMQTIGQLETNRRGLYTGAVGALCFDGALRLAMAIRTLVVDSSGTAHYRSGGGIVADSDPEREVHETHWKARQLFSAPAISQQSDGDLECQSVGRVPAKNWADWMGSGIEA